RAFDIFIPDLPNQLRVGSLNPSDWKTYVHVYPSNSGGVIVQYWHCFAYNEFSFLGFGNHGGDWDASIQVRLDTNLMPLGAWYSRHAHDHPGDYFPWSQLQTYRGAHPIVTIDGGGHAAYKDPQDKDVYWEDLGVPDYARSTITWFPNGPDGPGAG